MHWFLEKWPDVQKQYRRRPGDSKGIGTSEEEGMPRRQMPPNTAVRRMGCRGEL